MKRSFADILQGLDSDRAQKVARKLPEWAAVGAEIPTALALEQCSSSATAGYKAGLAAASTSRSGQLPPETSCCAGPLPSDDGPLPLTVPRVARFPEAVPAAVPPEGAKFGCVLDLTGGLGVDSWAFSRVAERVVYFERSEELAEAARRNFERLGAANVEVRCETVTPETELPEADLIYADPARRDAAGRKVFLLEDCTPDILTLLPMLLRKAPTVLLKLSPMADLAMLADRLGPTLWEIHVVELDGEVKEILCLLHPDSDPVEPEIVIVRLSGQAAADAKLSASRSGELPPETSGIAGPLPTTSSSGPSLLRSRGWLRFPEAVAADVSQIDTSSASKCCLRFQLSEERGAEVQYAAEVRPGDVLLEPCAALLKAGAFRLPCARWGLRKLAPSTHLYLSSVAPDNGFFKSWRVRDVLPFGAAAFKELRKRYPRADVTARNLPLGSAELQKKIGVAPGGDIHVFGCRLADASAVLIITEV